MSAYEESDEYCPYCDNHYVRRFVKTWQNSVTVALTARAYTCVLIFRSLKQKHLIIPNQHLIVM